MVSSLLISDHVVDFGCTISQISLYTAEWYCIFHLLFRCFAFRFNLSKLALLCHKGFLRVILNSANPTKETFECAGNFCREFLQTYKEDVLVCSHREHTCRALCNNNNDSVSQWWRSCDVRTAGSGSVLHSDESVTEGAAAAPRACVEAGYPQWLWSVPILHHPPPADPRRSSSTSVSQLALLTSLFRLLASPGLIPSPRREQSSHRRLSRIFTDWPESALYLLLAVAVFFALEMISEWQSWCWEILESALPHWRCLD